MAISHTTATPVVYNDFGALQSLKGQSRENPDAAIGEVASQFEALFVTMLMKSMRDTLPEDGILSSGHMGTYQEMFDQQLALDLSRHKSLGLADLIARQLDVAGRYGATQDEVNND